MSRDERILKILGNTELTYQERVLAVRMLWLEHESGFIHSVEADGLRFFDVAPVRTRALVMALRAKGVLNRVSFHNDDFDHDGIAFTTQYGGPDAVTNPWIKSEK